jgi:hypothetical protein
MLERGGRTRDSHAAGEVQVSACTQVDARVGRRREGRREGGKEGGREGGKAGARADESGLVRSPSPPPYHNIPSCPPALPSPSHSTDNTLPDNSFGRSTLLLSLCPLPAPVALRAVRCSLSGAGSPAASGWCTRAGGRCHTTYRFSMMDSTSVTSGFLPLASSPDIFPCAAPHTAHRTLPPRPSRTTPEPRPRQAAAPAPAADVSRTSRPRRTLMKRRWQFQAPAPPRHAEQRTQKGAARARRDPADPERLAQRVCAARLNALPLPPSLTTVYLSRRCGSPCTTDGEKSSRQLQHSPEIVLSLCRFTGLLKVKLAFLLGPLPAVWKENTGRDGFLCWDLYASVKVSRSASLAGSNPGRGRV